MDKKKSPAATGRGTEQFITQAASLPVSIPQMAFVCQDKPQEDVPEILQVIQAPPNLVARFKEIDGTFLSEAVSLLALVRRFYKGVWLFSVEPLILDDFGFSLADDFGNFHCLERGDNHGH